MANHRGTKQRSNRARAKTEEPENDERDEITNKKGGGWMSASPMAWVSAVVSLLSLSGMLYQLAFAQATIFNNLDTIKADVARNFKEDEFHRDRHVKNIERIDTTIINMGKLNVEMEVVKTKLDGLTDAVKDLRRAVERKSNSNQK